MMDLFTISTAVISDCGQFRYELIRRWGDGWLLEWIMLNPSTADAEQDDPTIRRCIGFARAWRFHGIRVTNLFPLRTPQPAELLTAKRLGVNDDEQQRALAEEHGPVTVCAWGSHKMAPADMAALHHTCWDAITRRSSLICLGYNRDGSPKHPLYVPKNAAVLLWPDHSTTQPTTGGRL